MAFRIRHIATRFALLLAIAAVVPLLAYGFISLLSLQRGTHDSIVTGNQNVATRAAEELRQYVTMNADLLQALAADLQETGLERWQQERILVNYILRFRAFREITLFTETGSVIASSRIGPPTLQIPRNPALTVDGVVMSPIRVDDDLLPTAVFGIHLTRLTEPAGWLTGEFSLEAMWRMVDLIRLGEHGFAMVVAPHGELIAHGDPNKKTLVAQARNFASHPLMQALLTSPAGAPVSSEYDDEGTRRLGVAARVPPLGWTVIVEQPTAEAYANAAQLERQLVVAISVALLGMVSVGYLVGRGFISPILALKRATHAVAAGQLDTRVDIRTGDEFSDLGDSFNAMAKRLIELREDVKRQERQAVIGKMVAGLVHDLAHPIQNLGNSSRLMTRDDLDAESRLALRATIDRELEILKRFMDDLRNVVRPRPVERTPLDVNASLAELMDGMRTEGEKVDVRVEGHYAPGPLVIKSDRFALGRVYRNLLVNAVQATAPGGRVIATTARRGDQIEISISDSGSGIAADRLATIFDDFVTTKRRGLGLGLAISKRIVEQLDGTIVVESELGKGTVFTLRFQIDDGTVDTVTS
jgi:signal transduction histidine kinase